MNREVFIAAALAQLWAAPAGAQSLPSDPVSSSNSGSAAEDVTEILVTAQKRSERLQDVPLAVNVVVADQLRSSGLQNTEALGTLIPGLNISKPSFGAFVPAIRGISTRLNTAENPTSIYVDGVLIPNQREGFRDLFDIEQITVLKGPQGTLFGRNATAGVIQISTRAPSFTTVGAASLSYDNYQTLRASSYVSGPVADTLAVSMTASYARQAKGWGVNRVTGKEASRLVRDVSIRGRLLFQPSESTDISLIGDYSDREDNGQARQPLPGTTYSNRGIGGVGLPGPIPPAIIPYCAVRSRYDNCSNIPEYNRFRGGGVSAQIDHDFGFAKFASITSYRKGRSEARLDVVGITPTLATSDAHLPNKNFTQEFQLVSASDRRLQWTAGVFYFHSRSGVLPFSSDATPFGALAPAPMSFARILTQGIETTESAASFAQMDYKLGDATTLTLGGRFTYEKRKLSDAAFAVTLVAGPTINLPVTARKSVTAEEPTWRIALNHKFSPVIMGYVSYNRGFKSGGFSATSPNVDPFLPEKLDDWEVGLKSELFDRALTFNVNGFYYKYKNMQILFLPEGGVGAARATFGNAAASTLYGIDVDFAARPAPGLTLNGGFELLHAKFDKYDSAVVNSPATDGFGGIVQRRASADGLRIPLAQNFAGTLAATYKHSLGGANLAFNTTATYNGDYFLDVGFAHQKSYVMLNGSVAISDPAEKTSLRLAVANALNKAFIVNTLTSVNYARATYGAPRTFTATVDFKF